MGRSISAFNRGSRRRLALLLILIFLGQILVPLQAHTGWRTTPDGQVVMICTLQGVKPLVVSNGDIDSHASSPAVRFSLLLSTAAPQADVLISPPTVLARMTVIDRPAISVTETLPPRRSIRAPPQA